MRILLVLLAVLIRMSSFSQTGVENRWPTVFRQVGHEVLLSVGDSTSRVLPIAFDGLRYSIHFTSPWVGNPQVIMRVVNGVFDKAGVGEGYLLEVVDEGSGEVVYSAERRADHERELVPCAGRILPKGKYALVFALVPGEVRPDNLASDWMGMGWLVGLVLVLVVALWIFKNHLKRDPEPNKGVELGVFLFYPQAMELVGPSGTTALTAKESDLLELLIGSAGNTLPKEELLAQVWGDAGGYEGRTLDVYVSKLRGHLKADPALKILNVRGVGYKLVVDARAM